MGRDRADNRLQDGRARSRVLQSHELEIADPVWISRLPVLKPDKTFGAISTDATKLDVLFGGAGAPQRPYPRSRDLTPFGTRGRYRSHRLTRPLRAHIRALVDGEIDGPRGDDLHLLVLRGHDT